MAALTDAFDAIHDEKDDKSDPLVAETSEHPPLTAAFHAIAKSESRNTTTSNSNTYIDETNNPNYKPDPNALHIDISGTSSSKPSLIDRTASAIGNGLGSSATGSAILGAAKGAFDTAVDGPAQLLANGAADAYPKNWPGYQYLQEQKKIANDGVKERSENFSEATQDHPTAAKVGEVAGSIGGALALPLGSVGEGAGLVSRLLAASKAGAVVGAAGSVEDSENFWSKKALGTAGGAVGGLIGYPVGAAAGKVLGYAADKATGFARPLLNKLTGAGASEMEAVANSSPELQAAVSQSVRKGEKINPDALARQVEADGLPIQMSLTPGQAKQDPMLISTEMNMRSKNPALIQKFNDQNNQLIQNLDHVRDTGAPNAIAPDHITAGETLINSGKKILDEQSAKTSALYKSLEDANGGSLPIDGQAFAIQANQALGKAMKGPFLPPQVQGILSELQSGKQPMTFENFENLRTMLGAEARKADRAGDGNTMGAVNAVRSTLENMELPPAAAALKPLADQARASAKQGFDMTRTNPLLGAIDSGKVSADNLIQKYVVGGQKADLINLASTLKDDPVALETMKAGTINYLKSQAVGQTGNFSQSNYNKSIQALGPKLDVLFAPEEAANLRAIGNVAKHTQLQPRGSYVNNSNTDVANLARGAGNMAGMAVNAATHSPVGSIVTEAIQNSLDKKVASKKLSSMLSPGAGVSSPSATSDFLQRRLPALSGTAASVPLASLLGNFATNKSDSHLGRGK